MGKQSGKKKKEEAAQMSDKDNNAMQTKVGDNRPKASDKDTEVFISMSQELKEEGNKLFQKRDIEGSMLKYEKAIKLLPINHVDVSCLRSNLATCYMQMGLSEYPRAIHECNLALEVTPKYSKALLKRARCYEALNRLDLALRDANMVVNMEPNNVMALEIAERIKKRLENKGLRVNDAVIELPGEYVEPPSASTMPKAAKEQMRKKKKSKKVEDKQASEIIEEKQVDDKIGEKKAEDKVVVEEKIGSAKEEPKKTVKLVFGEDIRWAQLPFNCSLIQVREVIHDRFPNSREVLIKYRDQEGDLVTITTDEELRWAEAMAESHGSVRLYIVEVNSTQDMFFERFMPEGDKLDVKRSNGAENGIAGTRKGMENGSGCIDEWIVEFANLFKINIGLDSNAYLYLHEHGMKAYSEALEDTITSEEAQGLFDMAADKFQELAALALFNWGNVHMSRAWKRVSFTKDASRESIIEQVKTGYDWAQNEYTKAGQRYEEALKIKLDFYEGFLALGLRLFEQEKLSWYHAISNNSNLETGPSLEVIQLYNSAEENMERGMQLWEELERLRLSELLKLENVKIKSQSEIIVFNDLFKDTLAEEAAEKASNVRSHINILWGTILYERSLMEFKLGIPVWQECLEVAVEKFELAGASATDIAVMIKNHCSNNNTLEGFGFKIDEIILSWNEMYHAKRFQSLIGFGSFRLERLLRQRFSKIYHALEHV